MSIVCVWRCRSSHVCQLLARATLLLLKLLKVIYYIFIYLFLLFCVDVYCTFVFFFSIYGSILQLSILTHPTELLTTFCRLAFSAVVLVSLNNKYKPNSSVLRTTYFYGVSLIFRTFFYLRKKNILKPIYCLTLKQTFFFFIYSQKMYVERNTTQFSNN